MKKLFFITLSITLVFSLFSCDINLFPKEEYIEPKPVINTDISQITFNNLRRTKIIDISGVGGFESTSEKTAIMASEIISEDTPQSDYPSLSYSVYRVKSGDMVGILAENFGITQDTIISVNNIRQTRTIQPGDYFRIPNIPGIIYTVRNDGETMESIAKNYKVDVAKCCAVNNLEVNKSLTAGTTLFVPDAELDWVTRQEINGDLFKRPIKAWYYISSYFGWRNSPFTGQRSYHSGIDMACPTGTKIYAALAGTVTTAGWSDTYGNYVIVRHHSGYKTLYAHMSKINVRVGQYVEASSVLGLVGSTGLSTGPHLHFTVYKNGVAVNPQTLWN